MKIKYKGIIKDQIDVLKVYTKVKLTYTLYPKTKRLCDLGNVLPVHAKFFEDALVEAGKLEDDNYKFIPTIRYEFGHIDRDNPRVEIKIEEIS